MENQTVSDKALAFEQLFKTKRLHAASIQTAGWSVEKVNAEYDALVKREAAEAAERKRLWQEGEAERLRLMQEEQQAQRLATITEKLSRLGFDVAGKTPAEINAEYDRRVMESRKNAEAAENEQQFLKRFSSANCPQRHAAVDEANLTNGKWIETRDKLVERWPDGFLVALLGIRGNGKTQMAVSVIEAVCRAEGTAGYIKALDFFRQIRATFKPDASKSEDEIIDSFAALDLMVIDECHQRGHSDFEQNTLINLVDRRYDAGKATILIANQSKQEFAESLGDSIVSRIHETGDAIVCDWPSFRKPGAWK